MIKYRKNSKSGEWQLVGLVSELHLGTVTVTKNDGTTNTEEVYKLSKPFENENGELMCFGYLDKLNQTDKAIYWIDRISLLAREAREALKTNGLEYQKFAEWIEGDGSETESA